MMPVRTHSRVFTLAVLRRVASGEQYLDDRVLLRWRKAYDAHGAGEQVATLDTGMDVLALRGWFVKRGIEPLPAHVGAAGAGHVRGIMLDMENARAALSDRAVVSRAHKHSRKCRYRTP